MKNKILFLFIGLFSLCAFAQDPYVVPSGRKDQVTKIKGGMAFDSLCIVPVRKTSENLYHQIDSIGRLQVDSDTKKLMYHNGTQWVEAGSGGGGSQNLQQTVDNGKVGIVNPDGENSLKLGMWQYDNIDYQFNGLEIFPGNTTIKGGYGGSVATINVDNSIRLEAEPSNNVDILGNRLTFNGVDVLTESKRFGIEDTITSGVDRQIDMGNEGMYFDNISEFQLYGSYTQKTIMVDDGTIYPEILDGSEVSDGLTGKSVLGSATYPNSLANSSIFVTLENSNEYEFDYTYDADSDSYWYVNNDNSIIGLNIISYKVTTKNTVNFFADLENEGDFDYSTPILKIDQYGKVTKANIYQPDEPEVPSLNDAAQVGDVIYNKGIRLTNTDNGYGVDLGYFSRELSLYELANPTGDKFSISGNGFNVSKSADNVNFGVLMPASGNGIQKYATFQDKNGTIALLSDVTAATGYGFIGVFADNYTLLSTDLTYRLTYFEYINTIGCDFYLPNSADCLYKVITIVTPNGQSVKLHGTIAKGADLTELDVTVSATLMAFNNNGTPKWVVLDHVEP